jgi:hypothetical protein
MATAICALKDMGGGGVVLRRVCGVFGEESPGERRTVDALPDAVRTTLCDGRLGVTSVFDLDMKGGTLARGSSRLPYDGDLGKS